MKIPEATKIGYADCPLGGVFNMDFPDSKTRRGRVVDDGLVSPTILAASAESITNICDMNDKSKRPEGKGWVWDEVKGKWFRVRKLTPTECFLLMGVSGEDANKLVSSGISKSQLYKMAGNSIVVDVMFHIFENLFYPREKDVLF